MEPNTESKPIIFAGLFSHGLDEKRRVQIPARWRPADGQPFEFTVIVWPKHAEGACLRVLPPGQMATLMADLDKMPNSDPNKGTLKRYIGRLSAQVELDKAGRICIPDHMAKAVGIEKQAVLVGMLDRFEIWNPERHVKVQTADEVMAPEAFRLME
jgi:MraZ protein